jgi:cell division topological specificity factor
MGLLDYFRTLRPSSAQVAKERLQILVAHERGMRNAPSYLPQMQQELLAVIRKYVNVDMDAISIQMEQDENREILEVNIVLPEDGTAGRTK